MACGDAYYWPCTRGRPCTLFSGLAQAPLHVTLCVCRWRTVSESRASWAHRITERVALLSSRSSVGATPSAGYSGDFNEWFRHRLPDTCYLRFCYEYPPPFGTHFRHCISSENVSLFFASLSYLPLSSLLLVVFVEGFLQPERRSKAL